MEEWKGVSQKYGGIEEQMAAETVYQTRCQYDEMAA